jgi:putative transposase
VTKGLIRYYGTQHLHFITCSCYRRQPRLHTVWRRNLFLKILEQSRRKYRFVVHAYVVMPEHFHLLITEPEITLGFYSRLGLAETFLRLQRL